MYNMIVDIFLSNGSLTVKTTPYFLFGSNDLAYSPILVLFLPSPYEPLIYLLSLLGLCFFPCYSTGRFGNGFMN